MAMVACGGAELLAAAFDANGAVIHTAISNETKKAGPLRMVATRVCVISSSSSTVEEVVNVRGTASQT